MIIASQHLLLYCNKCWDFCLEEVEMNFYMLIGPQAVGKMTVGQALSKKTGAKLFYNHMTIDLVDCFFD